MSENTKIEWADHTFSPWRGCTKVSAGCANCYAETLSKRNPAVLGQWGLGKPRVLAKNWNDPVMWHRIAGWGTCPCCKSTRDASSTGNCKRCGEFDRTFTRPRVFPSLCDWLDEEVPIEWLARFLQLIHETPELDWLLLTKRPENWLPRMRAIAAMDRITQWGPPAIARRWCEYSDAPKNVWLGTSVEDQANWDTRASPFLKIPARLRFLSVEPMLGPVNFSFPSGASTDVKFPDDFATWSEARRNQWFNETARATYIARCEIGIHWVIYGGESGPGARPCNVQWIRSGVKQCLAAGVPCFVKQLGAIPLDRNDRGFEGDSGPMGWPMDTQVIDDQQPGQFQGKIVRIKPRHPKAGDTDEWPEDLRVRQMPVI